MAASVGQRSISTLRKNGGLGIVYWSVRLKDLRTLPTIVTAHIFCACQGVVARDAKEMRNTKDTRTGFVSLSLGGSRPSRFIG